MKEETKEEKDMMLSPTSINNYFHCPFYFFKSNIEKVPMKKSIHLAKGTIVHDSCEKWFDNYEDDLELSMLNIFEREWKINPDLKQLKMSDEELLKEKKDASNILKRFTTNHMDKMEMLMDSGKAENLRHAWFLLRPKFREVPLQHDELRVRGRADSVSVNFDGMRILADYKTSNRYGIGIPEDYRRQCAIYALMYNHQEEEPLDFVSIIYLRFGEEPMLEVTPDLLRYGRDAIQYVRERSKSREEKDYPRKMNNLCAYCSLSELCDGTEEWLSKCRKEKLKKLSKKKK